MCVNLDDIRKVVQDLEAEKSHAICKNQNLREELNRLRDEICHMQASNDKLLGELECSDRTLKALKAENCKLENCNRQKDQEICCLRKLADEVERLRSVICHLEKDLDCIINAICKLEEQITDLERCIKEKDLIIRRIENKPADLENEICELENSIKCYTNENECLRQEVEECRCNFQKYSEELDALTCKLRVCDCARDKLQDQLQNLNAAIDHVQEAIQKEENRACKLQSQINNAKEENHKLKMENACLQEENCDLNKKLDCTCRNMKKLQYDYDQAHCECEEFKKCIEQFKKQLVSGIKCNTPVECCTAYTTCPSNINNCKYVSRARSLNYANRISADYKLGQHDGDCYECPPPKFTSGCKSGCSPNTRSRRSCDTNYTPRATKRCCKK